MLTSKPPPPEPLRLPRGVREQEGARSENINRVAQGSELFLALLSSNDAILQEEIFQQKKSPVPFMHGKTILLASGSEEIRNVLFLLQHHLLQR